MQKKIVVRPAFSLCLLSVLLLGNGAFSNAGAELSQQFRENLQRQYESGQIPDPKKNMSYEERLAIRKKQQKLEEEQQKRQQNRPIHPSPPVLQERDNRHRDEQDRYDDNRSSRYRSDRSYERIQEYCRGFSRPGTYEYSRCVRENGEMTWGDRTRSRDHDRYDQYDRSNRYDRYERTY